MFLLRRFKAVFDFESGTVSYSNFTKVTFVGFRNSRNSSGAAVSSSLKQIANIISTWLCSSGRNT